MAARDPLTLPAMQTPAPVVPVAPTSPAMEKSRSMLIYALPGVGPQKTSWVSSESMALATENFVLQSPTEMVQPASGVREKVTPVAVVQLAGVEMVICASGAPTAAEMGCAANWESSEEMLEGGCFGFVEEGLQVGVVGEVGGEVEKIGVVKPSLLYSWRS